jgi:hypothetical protein
MDAKARSKMTLSIMTEQDRKMEQGWLGEHGDRIIAHRINYILRKASRPSVP